MPETYRVAMYGRTGKGNYGHQVDIGWLNIPRTKIVAVGAMNKTSVVDRA